ncbi:hypothetical protein KQX54_000199 [Cotesia glomerata]|uniref:Uncharacterized protein n=1 Tax=Cotesia glomerata TaxID=32391 RepID=A0AAV7HZL1_COTGL|nr:hypothetical protein KQX54_000199 [Cotesia glomerata]
MVVYCRVKICKHKSKDKCPLHRFPKIIIISSVKPLVDISNPKAITHKQPQMIRIVQNVNEIEQPSGHIEQFTTVENREFTVCPMLEDVNQASQRIIHHKRKVSESGSGTSEESTGTSVSNKRYRTSVTNIFVTDMHYDIF